MLKQTSSFVLASFRPSTYPKGTRRPFTRCGLAGCLFEHPSRQFTSCPGVETIESRYAEMVFP